MNKMIKVLVAVSIAVLFVGCGDQKQPEPNKTVKKKGKPLWLSNPNLGGQKGVVTIVSKYNKKTKKLKTRKQLLYIAKLKARASFESRKSTNIDSTSSTRMSNSGDVSYKEKVQLKSNSIQTAKLIKKAIYEDEKDFYLWMVEEKQ